MKHTKARYPGFRQAGLWLLIMALMAACGPSPSGGVEQPENSDVTAAPPQLNRTDMAAIGIASAAESAQDRSPELALDADPVTYWQAGGEAPQVLEIDLGLAVDIGEIGLTLYQSVAGKSLQRVYGKGPQPGDEYRLLHEFSGETSDGQSLAYAPDAPWEGIRYLKIETAESPGAFGWRQVTVLPPDENPFAAPFVDSDADGLSDQQDWCPNSPGPYEANGC